MSHRRRRRRVVMGAIVAAAIACIDHREEEVTPPATPTAPSAVVPTPEVDEAERASEPRDPASDEAERASPDDPARVEPATVRPLDPPAWIRHRRAPRETLEQIAARYDVAIADLREWNDLAEDSPLPRRGRPLKIKARRDVPSRRKIEVEIEEGDSWRSIALRYGVAADDLRAYNWPYSGKMKAGNRIVVWIDPIVADWIAAGPDPLEAEAREAIRRGAVGMGSPDEGRLINGVRIPDGEGYRLRLPRSAYGTTHAVEQVVAAFASFHEQASYGGRIEIGAMSRPTGGDIGHHLSHQTGRDLDVRLPRRKGVAPYAELTLRRVDWLTTWHLVRAFAETDVVVIFLDYAAQRRLHAAATAAGASEDDLLATLQYPRGRGTMRGIVRHVDGHDQHLHVRFGCGAYEPECVP